MKKALTIQVGGSNFAVITLLNKNIAYFHQSYISIVILRL